MLSPCSVRCDDPGDVEVGHAVEADRVGAGADRDHSVALDHEVAMVVVEHGLRDACTFRIMFPALIC